MAITLVNYHVSSAPTGESTYRAQQPGVPAQFQPVLREKVSPNKSGTNHNVSVKLTYPLARNDATKGTWSVDNTLILAFSMTSLQNVVATTEAAEAYDVMIAFLQAAKASYVDGKLRNSVAFDSSDFS